jgi:hypothetical protein
MKPVEHHSIDMADQKENNMRANESFKYDIDTLVNALPDGEYFVAVHQDHIDKGIFENFVGYGADWSGWVEVLSVGYYPQDAHWTQGDVLMVNTNVEPADVIRTQITSSMAREHVVEIPQKSLFASVDVSEIALSPCPTKA